MNDITIPWHLIIPFLIFLWLLYLVVVRRKAISQKRGEPMFISILIFIIAYLCIVGLSAYQDIFYQWDLNRYDLDQDGFFTGAENTEAQKEAMHKLTNDTGRNFSFVTGLIFSFAVSLIVFIMLLLLKLLKRLIKVN